MKTVLYILLRFFSYLSEKLPELAKCITIKAAKSRFMVFRLYFWSHPDVYSGGVATAGKA